VNAKLRRPLILGVLAANSAFVAGCGPSERDRQTIEAWLACEECYDGQRANVRAIGQGAVPALERILRDGPSRGDRRQVRRKFQSIYAAVGQRARVGRKQYVDELEQGFIASYQKRAAISLGDIGGDRARRVLRRALEPRSVGSYRADVVQVIKLASVSLDPARFRGTVIPTIPGFGDTVVLRSPANEPFFADAAAGVDGSPYSPSEIRLFVERGRLGFAAVASSGAHILTLQNGKNQREARLIIRTLLDATDRRMTSCTDFACQIDSAPRLAGRTGSLVGPRTPALVTFLSLWRTPSTSDTLDVFKFETLRPLPIRAEVDWRQKGDVDLRWVNCSTGAVVGDTSGQSRANPERTSVVIPGRDCWALLVVLVSSDTVPIMARLRLTSP
jgi:hypothetical protein